MTLIIWLLALFLAGTAVGLHVGFRVERKRWVEAVDRMVGRVRRDIVKRDNSFSSTMEKLSPPAGGAGDGRG